MIFLIRNSHFDLYYLYSNTNTLVQATENRVEANEIECGVRTIILIKNEKAPHDYSFEFMLPKGNKFVNGCDMKSEDIMADEIAIVDENGFVNGVIKSPWAKDAEGKPLKTFYIVKGAVLTQHIEFNEDTKFPVIADPWYGTNSKTENIGGTIKKGFTAYAAGQGTDGFKFDNNGGYLSYSRGSGATATVSIDMGVGYKAVTLSANIGVATSGMGGTVSASYPVPKKAGWYKLRITEYYNIQKYKVLRRWKDPATQRVTWKEFSRNAKKVSFAGIDGDVIKQK